MILGGVEQWVMMRGVDPSAPPLILLHGGPGMSETPFFRHFNASLERHFNVVYWDQRGAGKSFTRGLSPASMTVAQLLSDLDELVDHVRARLGAQKVILFGHSWGSALGVLYAARAPAKVAAYVGSGQVGDWPASERASYAYVCGEAERRGDTRMVTKLRAIGPPPHTPRQLWVQRTALVRCEAEGSVRARWASVCVLLSAPEYSLRDLMRGWRGFRFTLDAMWAEVSRLRLQELAPSLAVPVFFFLGRRDHWVPPETSVAYFEALRAPSKRLVWFDRSGHEPFIDEAKKFNAAMVDLVRPVVGPDAFCHAPDGENLADRVHRLGAAARGRRDHAPG